MMGIAIMHCKLLTIGLVVVLALACRQSAFAQTAVTFKTVDGVTVYGTYYGDVSTSLPLILLFHQAGSNSAEYTPIAPRLVKDGFDCLAIDQRAGGSMFDATNRTATGITTQPTSFLDALKDLDATLAWAKANHPKSKIVVWGSSYSAALVFLLAAHHPGQISALLSFSPGEYLATPSMVGDAAAKVTIPVYITCSMDKTEQRNARHIFTAVASTDKTMFIPTTGGVHGSSTLRTDRDPTGSAENWKAVETFLAKVNHEMAPPAKAPPHPALSFPTTKPKPTTKPIPKPAVKPVAKPATKPGAKPVTKPSP